MADDSLIEEMRAAIRGDRERAEERRRREPQPASAVQAAATLEETVPSEVAQPQLDAEPAPPDARGRRGPLRWLPRSRTS